MIKVHAPFINPFTFNRLRYKEPYLEATVVDEHTAECCGDRYEVVDEEVFLVPGDTVWLCLYNRYLHIETREEHHRRVLAQLASEWSRREESER